MSLPNNIMSLFGKQKRYLLPQDRVSHILILFYFWNGEPCYDDETDMKFERYKL